MNSAPEQVADMPAWITVKTLSDIEFLVKESEVLTGKAGRRFRVTRANRLTYRIHWLAMGLEVEHLDSAHGVLDTRHLFLGELACHDIAQAQAAGQLFAAPVTSPTWEQ